MTTPRGPLSERDRKAVETMLTCCIDQDSRELYETQIELDDALIRAAKAEAALQFYADNSDPSDPSDYAQGHWVDNCGLTSAATSRIIADDGRQAREALKILGEK